MARQVWTLPPIVKIYEALGAVSDKRVQVDGDTARVTSSSGNKVYDVVYNPESKTISANDNASYWAGYLGYPAIAFLIDRQLLSNDPIIAKGLRGVAWKDINTQYKNDYDQVDRHLRAWVAEGGGNFAPIAALAKRIQGELENLQLAKGPRGKRPPAGY